MRTHHISLAILGWTLLVSPAWADEELDKLTTEFEAAHMAWFAKIEAVMSEGGESAMLDPGKMPPSPYQEFLPRFKSYAEKRAGQADAVPALSWILENAQFGMASVDPGNPASSVSEDAVWAVQQLSRHHAADPQLAPLMRMMVYSSWTVGRPPIVELLEKVAEKNPDRVVKAEALFSLGAVLMEESPFGLPGGARGDASARDAEIKRAMELFRTVSRDYADTEHARQATGYLFEAERLQVGMKAPEIVGQDADGKEIKLSQFLGQVVVLDFWGFW